MPLLRIVDREPPILSVLDGVGRPRAEAAEEVDSKSRAPEALPPPKWLAFLGVLLFDAVGGEAGVSTKVVDVEAIRDVCGVDLLCIWLESWRGGVRVSRIRCDMRLDFRGEYG